jgi:hypothetical protein
VSEATVNGHLGERELSLLLLDAAGRSRPAGTWPAARAAAAPGRAARATERLSRAARPGGCASRDPDRPTLGGVRQNCGWLRRPAGRRAPRRPLAWGLALLAVLLFSSLAIGIVLECTRRTAGAGRPLVPAWEVAAERDRDGRACGVQARQY